MLSLPKILLLLVVVVAVVAISKALRGRAAKVVKDDQKAAAKQTLDLRPCAVCGDYVSADGAGCGQADCPIAKAGGGD